jgi:acyl-CoA thioesterase-1
MKKQHRVLNIACFGDSIAQCGGFAEKDRWPTILQMLLDAWRPGRYAVYNRGVGGDTTANGLERMNSVLDLLPGVVTIQFGFNDANCRPWQTKPRVGIAEFRDNLVAMAQMAKRRKGSVIFILNHIPTGIRGGQGDGKCYYRRVAQYNSAIRAAAAVADAPVVDWPRIVSRLRIKSRDYLRDAVHLSANGNRLLAEAVFAALKRMLTGGRDETRPSRKVTT